MPVLEGGAKRGHEGFYALNPCRLGADPPVSTDHLPDRFRLNWPALDSSEHAGGPGGCGQESALAALRLAIDSLEIPAGSTNETEAELLLASVPVLVASYWRLQSGGKVIGPAPTRVSSRASCTC